jgi:hypothetical protein
MIGWWKFNATEDHNVVDSSGTGLASRLMGDAKIVVNGERRNVLDLDGDGDYVDCGNHPAFEITYEITVAASVNIARVRILWAAIVAKGDSSWRLSTVERQGKFSFAVIA